MPLTLGQCQNDKGLQKAANVCPTSEEFIDFVNSAGQRAKRRGDFIGTILPIFVCVRRGCVVWPRFVDSVRKINVCNQPVPVRNMWFEFLEKQTHGCWWNSWTGVGPRMIGQTKTSTHNDIFGDNRTIRAFITVPEDVGKTVRIFGIDTNGQPLRTNNGNGTYSDGIVITLANPFGSTSTFVRSISYVLKDVTQGNVLLYAYDTVNDVMEDLAVYDPSDTVPSFAKYQLAIGNCHVGNTGQVGDCGDARGVTALVKLAFIPARVPNDLVYIQNIDALKLLIMSIRYEDAGQRDKARQYEADAIRELNLEIADILPEDQTPVEFGELGGTSIGFQKCF